MLRGACWFFVASSLVALAGCGRGLFQTAEREPWRAEAEVACLKSGAVRETSDLVRINPISGPGVCGAEYPLKVAALGEPSMTGLGYSDDLRPPGGIGVSQPRWPLAAQQAPASYGQSRGAPAYEPDRGGPVSLNAPGVEESEDDPAATYDDAPRAPMAQPQLPRLGPPAMPPGSSVAGVGPVAVKPAATLACPIVSVLDRWLADAVQPAAMRWFGVRVVEIKQISAYACRGMNGNSRAHISEHAFGNALDIAAFTLADGRKITVRGGWHGMPEEQGFLRDVQGAACQHFNTVLAPGSNAAHADHIHVDLMRRSSRRLICRPAAVPGDQIAARASQRGPYAAGRDASITGSIGRWLTTHKPKPGVDDDFEDE